MRILFQRLVASGKRGLSISWEAFSQMKDVSLRPYQKIVVSLEESVCLNAYGNKTIHLYKHCTSKDNKSCVGGQFSLPSMNGHISGVKFITTFTIM